MTLEQAKSFINAKLLLSGKAMLTPKEQEKIDFSPLFPLDDGQKTTPERMAAIFNIGQQIKALL